MRNYILCFQTLTLSGPVSLTEFLVSIKTARPFFSWTVNSPFYLHRKKKEEKKKPKHSCGCADWKTKPLHLWQHPSKSACLVGGNGAIWVFLFSSRLWFWLKSPHSKSLKEACGRPTILYIISHHMLFHTSSHFPTLNVTCSRKNMFWMIRISSVDRFKLLKCEIKANHHYYQRINTIIIIIIIKLSTPFTQTILQTWHVKLFLLSDLPACQTSTNQMKETTHHYHCTRNS